MLDRPRRSLAALALAACSVLPPAILGSCQGGAGSGGAGTSGGNGGAGAGGNNGFFDAGFQLPDGCGGPAKDAGEGGDGSTGCEGVEGGVTYAEVKSIFNGCTGESCHLPFTHDSAVGVVASECCDGRFFVAPGNAAQSYILDKVEGHDLCVPTRMPLGGPPLSDADTLTIRRWICEGAPAN